MCILKYYIIKTNKIT